MSVQETTLEIHLDNLQHNVRQLKKHLKEGTRFLAVVKANSYGNSSVAARLGLLVLFLFSTLSWWILKTSFVITWNLPSIPKGSSPIL